VVWKNYLDILSRLRNEKGMTIMQIAHHEVKRHEDPSSDPIDKNGIKLYRKAADLVVEHADCVFFVKYKTGTVQKKNPKGGMSTQVLQGERKIYTQEGPGHHVKNSFFFFNDTATTEIYTLSLHDALPIYNALQRKRI